MDKILVKETRKDMDYKKTVYLAGELKDDSFLPVETEIKAATKLLLSLRPPTTDWKDDITERWTSTHGCRYGIHSSKSDIVYTLCNRSFISLFLLNYLCLFWV